MKHFVFGSTPCAASILKFDRASRNEIICWLQTQAAWTHAVTLTMQRSRHGYEIKFPVVESRCCLFLNRINRSIYSRHATRRKGYRIASVGFWGSGAYGNHPHVHLALQKPHDITHESFERLLKEMASTTKGLGEKFDVQRYYSEGWLGYMIDHGFDGWMEKLTFAAVCPKH